MNVGLEDVSNAQITAGRLGEVDVDVATGIDDGGQGGGFAGDEITRYCDRPASSMRSNSMSSPLEA